MTAPQSGRIGIIGGTGLEDLFGDWEPTELATPFGPVSARTGTVEGVPTAFIPRHGLRHSLLPHEVNYRANVWALRELGATRVLATAACGSLSPALRPGGIVLLEDFLDLTRTRPSSCRGAPGLPAEVEFYHVDMQPAYCPWLQSCLERAAPGRLESVVYACMEGPRFESPAEIRMLGALGAEVVGMTGLPEALLARELGLCYAAVGIVTNAASGMADRPLEHGDVVAHVERAAAGVAPLLIRAAALAGASTTGEAADAFCCPAAARRSRWFGEQP